MGVSFVMLGLDRGLIFLTFPVFYVRIYFMKEKVYIYKKFFIYVG